VLKKKDKKALIKCKKIGDTVKKTPSYAASSFTQYATLLERAIFNAKGDYITKLNFINIIAIAVIVSVVWFQIPWTEGTLQDKIGVIFFSGIFASCFFPAFQALFTFPAEKPVIVRERKEGSYRLSIYYLAKITAELPFELLFPLLFNVIVYWFVEFRLTAESIAYWFISICISATVSSSIGVLISSSIDNPRTGITIATIALILFMLSAGFYVVNMPAWLFWLSYTSFMKYSYNCLMITQFAGFNITQDPNVSSPYDHFDPIQGSDVMMLQNVTITLIGVNFLVLFGMFILFRAIAFGFLTFSIRKLT